MRKKTRRRSRGIEKQNRNPQWETMDITDLDAAVEEELQQGTEDSELYLEQEAAYECDGEMYVDENTEYLYEEACDDENAEYFYEETCDDENAEYFYEETCNDENAEYFYEEACDDENAEYFYEEACGDENAEYFYEEACDDEKAEYFYEEAYTDESEKYFYNQNEEYQNQEYDEEYDDDLEYIEYDDNYMSFGELPGRNFWEKIKNRITAMSRGEKAITAMGAMVLVFAVVTGIVYMNVRTTARQMDALETLGREFVEVSVAGKSSLLAMLDAQAVDADDLQNVDETKEYEEEEYEQNISVDMHLTSIQKDLKIKFLNAETGKLISNVPFSVKIKDPKGKAITWDDDDKDGIIYKKGISSGEYSVTMQALEDKEEYKGYTISTETQKVTVKDKIDYKKVDVSGEVKTEAEVDVSKEDTKTKETTESSLTDTVTWVESTSTELDGSYTQIDIVNIVQPITTTGTVTTVSAGDNGEYLKSTEGKSVYVTDMQNQYVLARNEDYYSASVFYIKNEGYKYTGWQTINGKVYYYDPLGNYVTGEQVIQGVKYTFGSDGVLLNGPGTGTETLGIDVSKWNGTIDWNGVKNSGISYVIIRCGYRGSSTGALIEDPKFKSNIQGAAAAGLKVGVYFFTQAVDEVEAVEEASMVLGLVKGYGISYPVFLDVEPSGGRADGISTETRTAVCNAFCQTIQNGGYTAGIYANKTWLSEKINTGNLGAYKIWLAQYAATPTYTGRYDLWQYKCTGQVTGISGNVDMNISYLGY